MKNRCDAISGKVRARLAAIVFSTLLLPLAVAQTSQPAGSTATDDNSYWLRVTGDRVNLRIRPDQNSQVAAQASRDAALRAVGMQYGWYRVIPPDGVFSLVSAKFIEQTAPDAGRVKVPNGTLRVRAGSMLREIDPYKSEVQKLLRPGEKVRILGRAGEWFKIAPPKDVYVYIHGDYAERVAPDVAKRLAAATPKPVEPSRKPDATTSGKTPTTQPDKIATPAAPAGKWSRRMDALEQVILAESKKPASDQAWTPSLEKLRPLAAQKESPRVAELARQWISRIERHVANIDAAGKARQIAHREERTRAQHEREMDRIRAAQRSATSRPVFDARGVLRPALAVPAGAYGLRYQLQDPFTRKVQAYVEFPSTLRFDTEPAMGKYVGVSGKRIRDGKIEIIRAERVTVLNP